MKAAVVTVSDGVSRASGTTRAARCSSSCCRQRATRWSTASSRTSARRSPQRFASSRSTADVILTTGGTGVSPRDFTPEATDAVLDRRVPGIAEALRADAISKTPHGLLGRGRRRYPAGAR